MPTLNAPVEIAEGPVHPGVSFVAVITGIIGVGARSVTTARATEELPLYPPNCRNRSEFSRDTTDSHTEIMSDVTPNPRVSGHPVTISGEHGTINQTRPVNVSYEIHLLSCLLNQSQLSNRVGRFSEEIGAPAGIIWSRGHMTPLDSNGR